MEQKTNTALLRIRKFAGLKAAIAIVVMFVLLSVASENFLTKTNLIALLSQSVPYLIISLGVTLCILSGAPDLSVGGVMCTSGIITIGLQPYMPTFCAALIAIAAGALVGFLNGFLVVHQKTEPWVITLGMGMLLKGVNLLVTDGHSVYGTDTAFTEFAVARLAGIPMIVLLAVVFVVAFHLLLTRTPFGRNIYAYGGNYEVAVYSGINARREKWLTFIISGMMAALGGIVYAARMNAASAVFGDNTALIINCSVVIGGTSFTGGVGGILQSVMGILLINIIENGMNMLQINSYMQYFVEGLLIALITGIDLYTIKRKKEKV